MWKDRSNKAANQSRDRPSPAGEVESRGARHKKDFPMWESFFVAKLRETRTDGGVLFRCRKRKKLV